MKIQKTEICWRINLKVPETVANISALMEEAILVTRACENCEAIVPLAIYGINLLPEQFLLLYAALGLLQTFLFSLHSRFIARCKRQENFPEGFWCYVQP